MLTVRGIGIVYGMGYSNKNRMPKMAQIYRVAQNVSYWHESSLKNRIKTCRYGSIFQYFRLQNEHKNIISLY